MSKVRSDTWSSLRAIRTTRTTARRCAGSLKYGADPVVAILDSTRAGETYDGIPIVGTVNDSLCFNPTTALVGVATQGGRFPPGGASC